MAHLFLASLQSTDDDGKWTAWLGASERQRLVRYQGHRRQQYLMGRALLRAALTYVVDPNRSPAGWRITEQTDLPPAVADAGNWHFSLSHSRDRIAVLLSDSGPCGVDIEFCKPRKDFAALADGWFHPQEISALHTQSPAAQQQYFYQLWTLKEAWLKTRRLSLFSGGMAAVTFDGATTGCANHSWWRDDSGLEYSVAVITAQPERMTASYGLPEVAQLLPLLWQEFAVQV